MHRYTVDRTSYNLDKISNEIEIFKINHKNHTHTYYNFFSYKILYIRLTISLYETLWAPNASGFHFLFPNLKHLRRHEMLREQSQV